ncbi:uncharacterized protein LOC133709558 [Rosa rugosa]|uniref:uncharacterized protein LOC133709558 n=1 Tax=Rosa rugosa TaxID=74645 RepID=UPI002B407D09|nr:uncharacterized protein LOC133709558 [Rosa rugosa]
MARAKLILICQCGGEFVRKDDGTLSYTGGDAHAVDINHETLIDDLKLKLAEMCNLEHKSLCIKYFLPGNRRTLITLSSDKDLKRMYEFHGNVVTADVFVMGKAGFDAEEALNTLQRACGIKLADSVTPVAASSTSAVVFHADANHSVAVNSPIAPSDVNTAVVPTASNNTPDVPSPVLAPQQAGSIISAKEGTQSASGVAHTSNTFPAFTDHAVAMTSKPTGSISLAADASVHSLDVNDMDSTPAGVISSSPNGSISVAAGASVHSLDIIDMDCTPADTVKKRRRTAAWKIGPDGPTIVSVKDDIGDKGKPTSRKKNTVDYKTAPETDNEDQQEEIVPCKDSNSIDPIQAILGPSNDVPSEELVTLWKDGITGVGQEFTSVHEFRDVLQKYAIAHRFMYRLKKNDTNRASCICIAEACSWRIQASWDSSTEKFVIKKMEKRHTCEGESWKFYHPKKNWLVSIIKDRLTDNPHLKPKEIVNSILQDFGITVNYTQVRRGIEDAKEQLMGSYKEAYNQLPWFCEKMAEANPGSNIRLFTGEDGRFQRLFECFHASIHGFQNGCRPIIFLDSMSLKSKYHETFFAATALDGDDGAFPVAFAIVDTENDDNWHWFLDQLRSAVSTTQSLTIVFDREKGLEKLVTEVFENCHHGYTMHHLLRSFKKNLRPPFHGDGKGSLLSCFVAAAQSLRLDGFKYFTDQIKQVSSHAYDWVLQIEQECWTNVFFKGEHYNHITVDVAETYANWIEEMRALPIIRKIEVLSSKLMELINTRRTDSCTWSTELTPSKEEKLQQKMLQADRLKVLFSTDTLFEVHNDSINVVDLNKGECSCLDWKSTGLPCCHVIAVFNCTGRNVYDFCSRYYKVDNFRSTYSESITTVAVPFKPLDSDKIDSEAENVLPPSISRPQSHDKEKQKKTKGVAKKEVFCSNCKETGHNKATCKAGS